MPMTEDEIISKIHNLSKSKNEFDLIPHVDGPDHKEILESCDVFALCSCLSQTLWLSIYKRALQSRDAPAVEHLTFLLLCVPFCATFWHRRKELVVNFQLSLEDEINFTRLILLRFPRATEPLQHRHWVLERLANEQLTSLATKEVDFCELLGDKHRCNFMVWQHRRWILERLTFSFQLFQSEWTRMNAWNLAHPMDISGWSYRAHLLRACLGLEDFSFLQTLLAREMTETWRNIQAVPENEALWHYRRELIDIFHELTNDIEQVMRFDAEVCIDPRLRQLTDRELQSCIDVTKPRKYSQPWVNLLYKRFLRWLAQTFDEESTD